MSWAAHDTAVYVVSTLNVLHSKDGHPLTPTLVKRLDVTQFAVYADVRDSGLYFIQLERSDGAVAGRVAYQLGWRGPRSLSRSITKLGVVAAPSKIADAFRRDPHKLMAVFTSTMPI